MEAIRRRVAREYRAELELFALKPSAAAAEFKVVPKSASSSQEETTHEGDDVSPAISSRDWTLQGLLRRGKRFKQVKRIPASWPEAQLLSAIEQHEQSGEPLIIEGWHQQRNWPRDLFDINWLLRNCGDQSKFCKSSYSTFLTIALQRGKYETYEIAQTRRSNLQTSSSGRENE